MMTEMLFYHLERQSLEQALPQLLEASLKRGWRVVVQTDSDERVKALNAHLWTYREDSFLPHGCATDGEAARQPIWLTSETETPNQAQVLFLVDGAVRTDIAEFERCVHIFDGGDATAVTAARTHWQQAKEKGLTTTYYRQTPQGKWEKA